MEAPTHEVPKVAEEAAHLAGHPQHMGKQIAAGAIGSSIASVGAFQVNSAVSRHSKKPMAGSPNIHVTVQAAPARKRGGK